ncbi:MAG: amidohydrolase [bacterium]
MDLEASVIESVDAMRGDILAASRWLYDHPELSGEEHESARFLARCAELRGFKVEHGVAGLPTAFVAVRHGGRWGDAGPRRRAAFLAEYDALPEMGHGCGHNMIGTVSVYAAIALANVADELDGDVVLCGTPSEETTGGKISMLEAGLFDGISAALMAHPSSHTEIAYATLASIPLEVEYYGRSSHAVSNPDKGVNALDAMLHLFQSVKAIKAAFSPTAHAPGVILHGGGRANVVPHYTKAEFSIRGKDRSEAEDVMNRVLACAHAAAKATGASLGHRINGNIYLDMRPDPRLAEVFRGIWLRLGGGDPLTESPPHGSIDIGNLSHVFPCLHPSFRITGAEGVAGHSREFAEATLTPFAGEQMVRAIKALATTGLHVLKA